MPPQFDVFLCHNSEDKPAVIEIAEQLQAQGLKSWLDVWELRPGAIWQYALEQQIESIGAAAVFVGAHGFGPWQSEEVYAFLQEFIRRHCPVIPVILPQTKKPPELPIFLRNRHWVDFRLPEPAPLEQLTWGITGRRPSELSPTTESMPITVDIDNDLSHDSSEESVAIQRAPEDDLASEQGINYGYLRDLLQVKAW
ncbi:MAG: toll/interleukin-1 receptor domain-containing protein, partial [Cyanobacteria bacterium P01_A01_bin.105]